MNQDFKLTSLYDPEPENKDGLPIHYHDLDDTHVFPSPYQNKEIEGKNDLYR